MTHTSYARSALLLPMCRLRAGNDLSRPNHLHQRAVRALMRPEDASKCLARSPNLMFIQICGGCRAGSPPTIDLGTSINSP
jgi:hypothetical protein